ncbi:MAG TPA: hypothetical protein VNN74_06845 [Candidatus Micrarchaeia archaeon]|nr:hypothetical protein [Candidatus Micrarchaeia archaeon]
MVQHQVGVDSGGQLPIQLAQEAQELLVPVPRPALAEHLAIQDLERGEEVDGAVVMALVVTGHGAGFPALEG